MLEIEKPRIETVELDGNYGKFVVEPLERGYGITLGNSLRRILLSSLPGAAITAIRIDGVLHEFSTIQGVLEDTTEIVLNLKNLLVKLHGDEPVIVHLDVAREGQVTAADIQVTSQVEILNPDLHIATLDRGGRLTMEITIEKGRGYVSAERNKRSNQPIGVIPVDSIFSPIRKVNYKVEDTRVGQRTDFDRLTLEVWTDGSIAPNEAVSLSARIFIEHLRLFVNLTEDGGDIEIMVEKEEDDQSDIHDVIAQRPYAQPVKILRHCRYELTYGLWNQQHRRGEDHGNNTGCVNPQRNMRRLSAIHPSAYDLLGILHRYASLPLLHHHGSCNDPYRQHHIDDYTDERDATLTNRLKHTEGGVRQSGDNPGKYQHRDSVADAALCYFLPEPHEKTRACSKSHDDQRKGKEVGIGNDLPAPCQQRNADGLDQRQYDGAVPSILL
jgi:DNA-directed RNA polymerase subunit alpha